MMDGSDCDNDVGSEFGCPRCREQNADRLEIHEDDTVLCLTCTHTYSIGEPAPAAAEPARA